MARSRSPAASAQRYGVALLLTCLAGYVDAFGWLTLRHVYTAQMSGNTVLVAVRAVGGPAADAALHAFTIAMFLTGLVASGVVIELGRRRGFRRVLAAAMALEIVCLGAFALAGPALLPAGGTASGGWALYLLVALTAVAMGAQNTSLRISGILSAYTTHVTGALTKFTEDVIDWGFAVADRRRGRLAAGRKPPNFAAALFPGALWAAFLAGAIAGAAVLPHWGIAATLLPPLVAAAAVGALDWLEPLTED